MFKYSLTNKIMNIINTSFVVLFLTTLLSSCQSQKNQVLNEGNPCTSLENAILSGDVNISTPYGVTELQNSYISDACSQKLFNAMDFQRASQAYIWSTPLISLYSWMIEQNKEYNTNELGNFAFFKPNNEDENISTINLSTPYIIAFYDLSQGPLYMEYPVGQTSGGILDGWQRPVCELGNTGPDKGLGGNFIIVGPNDDFGHYKGKADFVYQSETNILFIGIRFTNTNPVFIAYVESHLKLSKDGENYPKTRFHEVSDNSLGSGVPHGLEYWKLLSQIINKEPVREIDKPWMAMLEPLGITKGKTFNPDERQAKLLLQGANFGELLTRNLQINPRFSEPYWHKTHWFKSYDFHEEQETVNKLELDERASWFYETATHTHGMVNPTPELDQVYMTSKRDDDGRLLRGDKTYKLKIPADVPVKKHWSITLYSENSKNSSSIDNTNLNSKSIGSKSPGLIYNKDGSVDIYVGTKAPEGKEANFIQTNGADGWFVYFRLDKPTDAFFDKSFSLDDWKMIAIK